MTEREVFLLDFLDFLQMEYALTPAQFDGERWETGCATEISHAIKSFVSRYKKD